MHEPQDEDARLRSAALQNASSILAARQRAERELLRTQQALRESQERLTAALNAAATGTFRWTIRTNVVEWDGNLDRLFGLEPGRSVQSLEVFISAVHPDDRTQVFDRISRCARDGGDFDMEFRVVWPDGSVHWVHDKAKTFTDADGQPLYMTGACAEVTSRRAAAEALRESEARLRAIFNQAAVGFAVASLDGRFLEMNRRFSDVLGYAPDELLEKTFAEVTYPDDLAETMAWVRRLLDGSVPEYALEKRYVRKDGTQVWSLTTVTILKDASGQAQRFIGVIEDISARKRTEEALREETRVLEILNETGKTLASRLDVRGVVQAVTDAATAVSGAQFGAFFYNTTDENGDSFLLYTLSGAPREAFERFGQPRATALFGPTFRGEPPIRVDDVTRDPRYGQMSPHHGMPKGHLPVRSYLAVPVVARSGEVIGGLFFGHSQAGVFSERAERLTVGIAAQAGIAIDNARLYEAAQRAAEERKALLESERAARSEAERMSEVKDAFLATLSHELRTPLNAILGWSQILKSDSKSRMDLAKGLDTIERNARVQAQLIEDLLDMSRIASGKLRLDLQPIEPAALIEGALETVRPAAVAKGLAVETFLDSRAGPITADAGRLQQVIWNLLSNAIKFTPSGGTIRVLLQPHDGSIEIGVADTGVGIKSEFIPHLFERFRQGDASTTRKYGGLGLGLSIVKSLVELHGGTVSVASPGLGSGTTVTVRLPVNPQQRPQLLRERPQPALQGGSRGNADELSGLTVLVVDDQLDARELIRRLLEDCSARVLTAASAHEALGLVTAHKPDVLVTDIGMPEVDGFELLRRVRALGAERGGRVPAVALTAFARSEDRTRALRAGFRVHVSKPVDPSELVATVASVAGRSDSRIA